MEQYKFNCKGNEFILKIDDKHPRFHDEGVLEMITLLINGFEIYKDSFGREKTLKFLLSDFDNEFVDMSHDKYNKRYCFHTIFNNGSIVLRKNDYDIFINWLIESLTHKNIKRIIKINRIKDKILEKNI